MNALENTVVENLIPSEFYLSKNYPNPFSEKTVIKYCVAYKTNVKLEVLDTEGKVIKILINEEKEAGTYEVEFNASISHSIESLADGKTGGNQKEVSYFYRLEAGNYKSKKKMLLSK